MMPAPPAINREVRTHGLAHPAKHRKNKPKTSCGQTEQNADPDCQWYSDKHPEQTGCELTFVYLSGARDYDAQNPCDDVCSVYTLFTWRHQ